MGGRTDIRMYELFFSFLFLLTESLLENLSAVHHVLPNSFANPLAWTARSCSKH